MASGGKVLERLHRACSDITAVAEKPRTSAQPCSSSYSSLPLDDLRDRLFSYTTAKWKAKPREISVRTLALHGWICLGDDILQCVLCKKYMNVSLPSLEKVDIAVFKSALRKIKTQIIEAHESTCAMRNAGTELIEPFGPGFYLARIKKRFESLKNMNLSNVNVGKLDESTLSKVSFLQLDGTNAVILACCGWHKSGNVEDVIQCDYCERSVGLWMFRNSRELNAESEHCRWCAYIAEFHDGVIAWEHHLLLATLSLKRKRKVPMAVYLAEKVRILSESISPNLLEKFQSADAQQ